ncbi:TetR/AcrR family transcriptional regulator [uncultured Rhodoblastus sp.]|uniref:TetR/AcrR family transcriptional regulator n=1 Tax=uncultured Rhodoblastus sp. TaxID=543037 RepID=UPI0025DB07E1|nr:TetR/AcrR family transcriptional regulator [uncultured Rhodoblastus sp.]
MAPLPQTQKGAAAPQRDAATGLKSRLTAAARKMLESDGLAGLSLRAAARASGVSHMAPYRHFASKDELLAAIAEQGFLDLTQALDEAVPAEGETPPVSTGVAYVLFALANPSLYRLMFSAQLQPCDRFPGLIAAGEAAFARCVAVARAEGFACPDDAEAAAPPPVAAGMWSLVHGLASLAIDALIRLPDDDAARRAFIARVLTSSMAPPGISGTSP